MTDRHGAASPALVGPYLATVLQDEAWLTPRVRLIAGGMSNLTYLVESAAGAVILRRPPAGHGLATAHDIHREQRVMSALAGSGVPVPRVLDWCPDSGLLGQPFYTMEAVEGHVVRETFPAGYAETADERRRLCTNLLDVLARLHATDPAAVGLADLGRPDGFLVRQLARWLRQAGSSGDAGPELEGLAASLRASLPQSHSTGIVHGDYRLDNVILDPVDVGRIKAVLDWEMCTLGDQLTDLGLLLAYWDQPGDPASRLGGLVVPSVTGLPGMLTRADLAEQYAVLTGTDLSDLVWYLSFAFFKLAVVCAGLAMRTRAGDPQTDQQGQDVAGHYTGLVPVLIELGTAHLVDGLV